MKKLEGIYVLNKDVKVLAALDGTPVITTNEFGKGRTVYLSNFQFSFESTRLLFRAICYGMNDEKAIDTYISNNIYTECAYYSGQDKLVVINNTEDNQETDINTLGYERRTHVVLKPFETVIISGVDQ